ncbi:deoxyguanosinetriphosphate triphosphohydrolase [Aestuariibacter sp. A3R04]|uniref:deoxyguanosinetriphosphate triphosphohydrolase n=1 Tax=Aestuariibacter sp. A3R04 TaxID=2841571 RepID=UPI001C096EB8|nr:deoxyguanosinetriphosphate triphosphohydrolase [Aestuariibacter sp. A3R04]MBU3022731.1 deoxyguanosinetriphosphate triphosphohydrolase [Aestuariibacter sp. A3R04]
MINTNIHHAKSTLNVVQLSFPFDGAPSRLSRPRGWCYLLSNSVAFKKDMPHTIRMQKPDEETVPAWISKLITSGQCKTIYVENLALNASERANIQKLCHLYAVSVINLQVKNDSNIQGGKNVVVGPW